MVLDHRLEIVKLSRCRTCGYDFDLSIVVNEDIIGMQIAYFFLYSFELVSGSDHIVKEVPDLSFLKKAVEFESILYFALEHIWKVIIDDLD